MSAVSTWKQGMRSGTSAREEQHEASVISAAELKRWFPAPSAGASATARLVCFPYAGGGTPIYRPWRERLAPAIQLCPVELPGRWSRVREAPSRDLLALARAAAQGIAALPPLPTALFGYSYGALLGYEVAHALRDHHGIDVSHLYVAARQAPHLGNGNLALHGLPEGEFRRAVEGAYDSGFDPGLLSDPDMAALLFGVLRADIEAVETYEPPSHPPLPCPVSVFGGTNDHLVSEVGLDEWRRHTTGAFSLTRYQGGHFFIRAAWSDVVDRISREIAA